MGRQRWTKSRKRKDGIDDGKDLRYRITERRGGENPLHPEPCIRVAETGKESAGCINGAAFIDEVQAAQVRGIYEAYLSGKGYMDAAKSVGLEMFHSSVKRMLQTRYYLGDDFYPAIIDQETFDAAEAERLRRMKALGRKGGQKPKAEKPIPTKFHMTAVRQKYRDPYKQAAYVYSLIESEE